MANKTTFISYFLIIKIYLIPWHKRKEKHEIKNISIGQDIHNRLIPSAGQIVTALDEILEHINVGENILMKKGLQELLFSIFIRVKNPLLFMNTVIQFVKPSSFRL